jgi:hypothetical protein
MDSINLKVVGNYLKNNYLNFYNDCYLQSQLRKNCPRQMKS